MALQGDGSERRAFLLHTTLLINWRFNAIYFVLYAVKFYNMDITEEQRKEYRDKVIEAIENALKDNKEMIIDLSDIGNEIGIAVGSITCKDGKDLNIWSFEKDDFENGFNHGYSLKDGSH